MSKSKPETADADLEESGKPKKKKPRGFAAMNKARVQEIASLGGKAAHAAGTAHEFTPEEARKAGSLGGKAVHEKSSRTPKD